MSTELPKHYDPAAVEPEMIKLWDDERCFHAEPTDPGEPYCIVIPPPNVTAALHLGHALNNTIQDILVRRARMQGKNAVWLPGTDHAGIATQTVVEKRVMQEEGKRRTEFTRDAFVGKIQKWKDEYEKVILGQLKSMGCSCDWDRTAFTMDEPRARAVREAFFQLFKAGLIYRGKRLVNWDPVTQTALSDDEVEMEEIDGHFYYLRYPLCTERGEPASAGGNTYITVATTRPETMLGDTAIAINPTDPRAAELKGKFVKLPIVNRIIPIIEDDYVVKPVQFGGDPADIKAQMATGFLKVTPAHDPNDWEIGQRHKLDAINVMAPDASISDKHGWTDTGDAVQLGLIGKSREEARKIVVDFFKTNGLLEDAKPYRHSVGHSYRSHVPIEPYLSDQWYCKVTDDRLAGAALQAMAQRITGFQPVQHGLEARDTNTITFHPERYAKTYESWHENIRDWCISRQLWWGHRIPVWSFIDTFDSVYSTNVPESKTYHDTERQKQFSFYNRIQEKLKQWVEEDRVILRHPYHADVSREIFNNFQGVKTEPIDMFLCVRREDDLDVVRELESMGFSQDTDVLDTWFSSALWPLSTLGWPDDSSPRAASVSEPDNRSLPVAARGERASALTAWNPTAVLCTAREIITLWVSRMVMFNLFLTGIEDEATDKSKIENRKSKIPFKDVFIHAMIQDGEGQKMSKSLGNGVDPLDIIHSHGADAMRFTLAAMTTHTQDLRMPVDMIDPHSGEMFTPAKITTPAGYVVAAPIQTSPKDSKKKMVSSFGLASGQAKTTPDMPLAKNTSSKFDLGRNFCNKIWNAARFVLSSIGSASGSAAENTAAKDQTHDLDSSSVPAVFSVVDLWILSRASRTIIEADKAIDEYRFDQYAKGVYDFFWRDLCDWYLEAIKPAMRDPARRAQTSQVLASVLDVSLRLLHPIAPFITEKIWEQLNEVAPVRGIPGRLECPMQYPDRAANAVGVGAPRLVRAPWPRAGEVSESAEHIFPKLQEVIVAVRQIRNDHKVEQKRVVDVTIVATSESCRSIESNREIVELLGTCKIKQIATDAKASPSAARATAAGCEIFVEGLVDESAELARKSKRLEELNKQIAAMQGRLSNESYTAKAPKHLVDQTQQQLANAIAERDKLA